MKKKFSILVLILITLVIITGCKSIVENITEREVQRITEEKTKDLTENFRLEDKQEECDSTLTKRQFSNAQYYPGPLIDTHLHMPVASQIFSETAIRSGFEDMPHAGQIPTSKIVCLMKKEGITKSFGFFLSSNIGLGEAVKHVKDVEEKYPGKFVSFFQPPLPLRQLFPESSEVKKVLDNNPGLYDGMGEVRFDFNLAQNELPNDKYELEMYDLSDDHNLIVQMHPDMGQAEILKQLLEKYPNVIFLVHLMKDEHQEVVNLIETHENMYYSLDAEISQLFGYHTIQNNKGPTKEEYLSFTRKNFNSLLDEALREWKPIIEKHPDKFTWGTDRWFKWHFDPEVGALIEELGRSFIGQLDSSVQEKFAYKNAEKMLQKSRKFEI